VTAFVLLLRGINVGGSGKLPMAGLKALLEELGCEGVLTYIQSGNAVFTSRAEKAKLSDQIAEEIETGHGIRPGLFLLTAAEMKAAVDANPWPEAKDDPKPMHLFFHDNAAKPDAEALDALLAEGEAWQATPRVLYFRAPHGIGRSKFSEKFGRHFKARMTGRNLRTCHRLVEMADAL
jgi:uncharacterized protein (DUF1697 family)